MRAGERAGPSNFAFHVPPSIDSRASRVETLDTKSTLINSSKSINLCSFPTGNTLCSFSQSSESHIRRHLDRSAGCHAQVGLVGFPNRMQGSPETLALPSLMFGSLKRGSVANIQSVRGFWLDGLFIT